MVSLVLVGTVHRDPQGHDKLWSILREEVPDYLTLEMSPYAVRYRREKGPALARRASHILIDIAQGMATRSSQSPLSHPAVKNIFTILDFPFEYQAVSTYSKSHGIPCDYIDRSDFSRGKILRLEKELVTRENLRALLRLDPRDAYRETLREYGRASVAFKWGQAGGFARRDHREMAARDRFMAGRIRHILKRQRCQKLLHVGGWEHLIDAKGQDTLFALLSDLSPRRRLLPR